MKGAGGKTRGNGGDIIDPESAGPLKREQSLHSSSQLLSGINVGTSEFFRVLNEKSLAF